MTRTDLLNHLIQKHGLKSYLEIGLQDASQNFDKIICEKKWSVDPDPNANASFCCESDVFFELVLQDQYMGAGNYNLIFIDGLHTAEQVKKDFENALQVLSPNGFIVLHDCNPLKEEHTIVPRPTERGHWNGDVYKYAIMLSANHYFKTIDIDNGCGIFSGTTPPLYKGQMGAFSWEDFNKNRKELLNLISWEQFINTY